VTERATQGTIRVIGVGNDWRGDDAVGLLAARLLRDRLEPSVEVRELEGGGLALLELMEGADHVILIDGVIGAGRPGEIVRLDLSEKRRWGTIAPRSTHALGVAEAMDLAELLGRLPERMVLYGVEIDSVVSGDSLSEAVQSGLEDVVEQITKEIKGVLCTKFN